MTQASGRNPNADSASQDRGVPRRLWVRRSVSGAATGAILLSLLFVASSAFAVPVSPPSGLSATGAGLSPHSLSSAGGAVTAPSTAHASASTPTPRAPITPAPAAPIANGPATFFDNHPVPGVISKYLQCGPAPSYSSYCTNNTDEPSVNYTSNGVLAVAYTAYSNQTECAGQSNTSTSVVGFVTSRNLGQNWGPAQYLSNPVCTGYDSNFSAAAQPSITSLANGTLVIAYEQFNQSGYRAKYCTTCWFPTPDFYYYYMYYDQVVVRESYNNGTSWTNPTVLNSVTNDNNGTYNTAGYQALQPRLAAIGDTVYATWTNYTNPNFCGSPSLEVNVRASTDGGATWGTQHELKTIVGSYCSTTNAAWNPSPLVLPNGTLEIAYLTGLDEHEESCGTGCLTYFQGASMQLATSTNNGSSYTYNTIDSGVNLDQERCCAEESYISDPTPAIAYGATNSQLYVAFDQYVIGDLCEDEGTDGYYCGSGYETLGITVANSSDGGNTWALHNVTQLVNTSGGWENAAWNPAISVTPDGVLHLQTEFDNDTQCLVSLYPYACGAVQEVYLTSSDNGTTFTPPILVSANFTGNLYLYYREYESTWDGQYASMLTVGSTVLLAWTNVECLSSVTAGAYCYFPYYGDNATVVVSTLYSGTGLTVTFSPTGLPAGVPWSVNVMGNERQAVSPSTLSVSGLPPGQTVDYSVPWVNYTYGVTYEPTLSTTGPTSFSKNTTITATFAEQVLFNLRTTPAFDYYAWLYPGEYSNYAMSPDPGSQWVTPGTSFTITLNTVAWTYPYDAANMSFQSWTGTGPGNYTGLSPNITVTPTGPVNETANFLVHGYCSQYYVYPTGSTILCFNETSFPLSFNETGLPQGVNWSVTTLALNGTATTLLAPSGFDLNFQVAATPTQFSIWTIPDGSTGKYWVGTSNFESPVEPINSLSVHVNFTLVNPALASFDTRFVAVGLPAGTPWSLELNGTSYGVQANNTTMEVGGGGPYTVNASAVYLEDGYGYYASTVSSSAYVINDSGTSSGAVPGSLTIAGPSVVTITFKPMYLLTTVPSTGGTVTPGTGWNNAGTQVTLTETPSAHYHFVGWAGSGSGSTTTAQDSQTSPAITPTGPVTEFATFRANPVATWNLTVNASGLPFGTAFSLSLGNASYTGTDQLLLGEIANGSYAISAPYVYYNSTNTTRFEPVGFESSLTLGRGDMLSIIANGTLTIVYQAQYLLAVAATPASDGTISPVAGAYWDDSGAAIPLTATASPGFVFVSWNSSSGTMTSTQSTYNIVLTSPLVMTAQFKVSIPRPPELFGLTITETGLPTGAAWNVSAGTTGAGGVSTSLTIAGLNGTYAVSLPTVSGGAGIRWIANETSVNLSVVQNRTVTVSFTEQFMVSVTGGAGGTITPTGTMWAGTGASIPLVATPNATSSFVGWTGTGAASYTGSASTTQLTVSSPVTEVASFTPNYPAPATKTSGSSTSGMPLALGLLVGLLVVGLLVGLLVGSRRRSPPSSPPEEWQPAPSGAEEPGVPSAIYEETPETTENPQS